MSYRNGVIPKSTGKGRHNLGKPSFYASSSALTNSTFTDYNNWGPRSSFSSRKAPSRENNEKKNRAISIDREDEQECMDFGDNNRSRRSQSPCVLNNNRSVLLSKVDFHQKSGNKLMHHVSK